MQNVSDRRALNRPTDGPATLYRLDVMRHKAIFVSFRRSRIDRRETKNARTKVSLCGIVFNVSLSDQLRPLQSRVTLIFSAATLWDLGIIVSMRTINIFRRGKDKDRVRLHLSQEIYRSLDICAKAILRVDGIFAQVSSEVNYNVVIRCLS